MAEYDFSTKERAENLYIKSGLTIAEIAKETGVSEKQLGRWAREGGKKIDGIFYSGWRIRQKEYQEKKRTIDENLFKALEKLAITAEKKADTQSVYAAVQLYKLEAESRQQAKPMPMDKTRVFMEIFEWILNYYHKKKPKVFKLMTENIKEEILEDFKKWVQERG